MPDLQIKIVDEDDTELTENQIGEICLKGSFVVDGYDKQKSDFITGDGWLKTGDLGYYNQADYLFIADRKKDMINRGGEKICSFDIENAIHELPGIAEAVVVGVPDDKYMEVPAAMVKLEKGEILRVEEIKEMLKTRVARFKIPEYVVIVEDIPKTQNGKIDKRAVNAGRCSGSQSEVDALVNVSVHLRAKPVFFEDILEYHLGQYKLTISGN